MLIPIDRVELIQARSEINSGVVDEYAEAMLAGATFPPIDVLYGDGHYWCWDGSHRVLAARKAHHISIEANAEPGSHRDAILKAAGANATHGLRRTNADKRRAVQILLDDPEWSQWSNREIARRCKVGSRFVDGMRANLSAHNAQIADRKVERSGTVYTMNTANIGQRQVEQTEVICRDCGTIFEYDGWAICRACRKAIVTGPPKPDTTSPALTTKYPPVEELFFSDEESKSPPSEPLMENLLFDAEKQYPTEREIKTQSEPSGKLDVHFSSETPEHYTPKEIIDATLACLGTIDLDPCSNSHDKPNVPAACHFTIEDDGLSREWNGKVYMNPPYGREIEKWITKLCTEYETGHVTEAIALVPSRTETQWWLRLRDYPVCFIIGRLTFVGNDNPAPFPSAIFYMGDNIGSFYHAFFTLGDIWQRIEPGWSFGE